MNINMNNALVGTAVAAGTLVVLVASAAVDTLAVDTLVVVVASSCHSVTKSVLKRSIEGGRVKKVCWRDWKGVRFD